MPKLKALILLPLSVFFLLIPNPGAFAEDITITTYYPAPYGVYREMRSKRMAIGDAYYDSSQHCWPGGPCPFPDIDANADLIIEGNVGIGTTGPESHLHVSDPSSTTILIERSAGAYANQSESLEFRTNYATTGFIHQKGEALRIGTTGGVSTLRFYTNGATGYGNSGTVPMIESTYTSGNDIPKMVIDNAGNVGIGTDSPSEELEVNGNIIGTPIMGNWYPTAHGPNAAGGQHILVTFNASQSVTNTSYFTNLGGTSGIRVNVAGYYHVEFVTLVRLGAAGDYGHVYLRRNGGNIDLDHGHYRTEASWDDRHCSWKGYMSANDYIQVNIYHQKATPYWYHNGPLYTRLTIQRLN